VGLKRMLPARTGDTDSEQEAAGATIIPEPGSLIADLLDMDLELFFQEDREELLLKTYLEVARTSCLLEGFLNPTVFLKTYLAWEEQLMLGMFHPSRVGSLLRRGKNWRSQSLGHSGATSSTWR
jgi:hypothetical protein